MKDAIHEVGALSAWERFFSAEEEVDEGEGERLLGLVLSEDWAERGPLEEAEAAE